MAMSSSEISKEQIINPVFIVSLPRTGTTILHRTMSKDTKRYKCFDMCDMVLPLPKPIPRWDIIGREQKALELQSTIIQKVNYIYPNFFKCMSTMHEFIPCEVSSESGVFVFVFFAVCIYSVSFVSFRYHFITSSFFSPLFYLLRFVSFFLLTNTII